MRDSSHASKKSKIVTLRLENATYDKLHNRLKGRRSRHQSVAAYLKDRIEYDTNRKHKSK
jgi:hypothetical protein